MYFQYALVAKDSTILADKSIINWDYREVSNCILGNLLSNENVFKLYKKPNTFYVIRRPDKTTFISVCISQIPENIQERFLLDLEKIWIEKNKWYNKLFSKKKDIEIEINSLIQRYNDELNQKIQSYIEELENKCRQISENV